jgi:hypothetical protein
MVISRVESSATGTSIDGRRANSGEGAVGSKQKAEGSRGRRQYAVGRRQ